MTQETQQYSIPTNLLQAIVNILNEQPARVTRDILNAIAHICAEQDKNSESSAKAKEIAEAIEASKKPKE